MPRLSILGACLLAIALAGGYTYRPAFAEEPGKKSAPAASPAPEAAAPAPAGHEAPPAAEHGGHGGGGEPDVMSADAVLGLSTLVVFLLLLFVLYKFAWGPLRKALDDREHHLDHTLRETERARHEAEQVLAELRNQMAEANGQVRALIDKAHRDAEGTANEILRKAQAEAEASRDRARREIETARDQALVEIWSKTADLAVAVAGKVLERQLSADEHRRLVEQAVNEVPAAPRAANGHGGHG